MQTPSTTVTTIEAEFLIVLFGEFAFCDGDMGPELLYLFLWPQNLFFCSRHTSTDTDQKSPACKCT